MDIRRLAPDLWAGPQVRAEDIGALESAGVRALICARPDGEEPGQPDFDRIRAAAARAGIAAVHVPVTPGAMTAANAAAYRDALARLPRPILAYCRSGARVAALHQACFPDGEAAA